MILVGGFHLSHNVNLHQIFNLVFSGTWYNLLFIPVNSLHCKVSWDIFDVQAVVWCWFIPAYYVMMVFISKCFSFRWGLKSLPAFGEECCTAGGKHWSIYFFQSLYSQPWEKLDQWDFPWSVSRAVETKWAMKEFVSLVIQSIMAAVVNLSTFVAIFTNIGSKSSQGQWRTWRYDDNMWRSCCCTLSPLSLV